MPLIFKKLDEGVTIGLWSIEEEEYTLLKIAALSETEMSELTRINNPARRKQWLGVRCAFKAILGNGYKPVFKERSGKPTMPGTPFHISISHCRGYAAVIACPANSVAIDIENSKRDARPIHRKFLSQNELSHLDQTDFKTATLLCWCAKECLYKTYAIGQLDFKKNIFISPFQYNGIKGKITGQLLKKNFKNKYQINYEKVDDILLVYITNGGINQLQ